ncbi:hypothetical protein SEA_ACOLYTE_88 [Mycobacterium phage Acolyte]|nr:hypothetical protein SEA_ACOLYTE_88 [Mycobacterium phage Acolyte]
MMSSDHDTREDIASELWTVAELLADQGKPANAHAARTAANDLLYGEGSIPLAMGLLGHYENLLV